MSWVIREKASKIVVCETFSPSVVTALNIQRYEAVPIHDYLAEFNRRVREAQS